MALMAITMIVLSFVQIWIANTTEEMTAYGSIPAEPNGWPRSDQRGAFLILNEGHTREYTGTLVQLLPVTTAGVIDEEAGAHFLPADLQSILIQAAALYEPTAYRVERIGDPEPGEMIVEPQPGTKVLLIAPRTGVWKPGAYVIDIPMDGMDGGRLYFQFYIDKE
jgi:hypothetical protein